MAETYDLTDDGRHRITVVTAPSGEARYSCSCKRLVDGDVEAAHYHSDLVTP